jgi:hypothetical protein
MPADLEAWLAPNAVNWGLTADLDERMNFTGRFAEITSEAVQQGKFISSAFFSLYFAWQHYRVLHASSHP